jgi:multiple sugar transport system permease protein
MIPTTMKLSQPQASAVENVAADAPADVAPRERRKRRHSGDGSAAFAFLAPSCLGFMLFTFVPVVASLLLAFCDWDLLGGLRSIRWVGLTNFQKLLGFYRESGSLHPNDPDFWQCLFNTGYLMLGIPLGMAGSLGLALLLNQKLPLTRVFRTIFFLPTICVPVAIFLLWRWIFNHEFGLLNWYLARAHIAGPDWLGTIRWAKPAIMIASLWVGVGGGGMLLYLAALQDIPRELYEAAEIDGAGPWQRFRNVTWPLISPTTFFIFITSIIGAFQGGFEAAYMMTQGGPAGSTRTLAYYIYQQGFVWFRMGYAAAIAWILFLLILVITLANWRFGGRRVHYY